MDSTRIAQLLRPFLATETAVLSPLQLEQISIYIDLLLRWNARVNLTAIRQPEEIVTRHFGESLFAARHLFPSIHAVAAQSPAESGLLDVGSGAGFPGLPIKIWAPPVHVTLIESNQKKATFLREVIRSLTLTNVDVFSGRAEHFPDHAETVTLRAVERFESALPTAARLVKAGGRLALLIGESQIAQARELVRDVRWTEPVPVPLSSSRILLVGAQAPGGPNLAEQVPSK